MRQALVIAWFGIAAGCAPTAAIVDGQRVARPDLAYTDHQYFALRHERAYPAARGPSSGLWSYGGRLVGNVCGVDVQLEAEYYGRFLDVSGYLVNARPSGSPKADNPIRLEVRDRASAGGGERQVHGTTFADLTGPYGPLVIDYRYNRDGLSGTIGYRRYDLRRDADGRLRGTMIIAGQTLPFELDGIDDLWSMPAADQAALVPLMMSCATIDVDEGDARGTSPMLRVSFASQP